MQLAKQLPRRLRPTLLVASLCVLFWLLFFVPWLCDALTIAGQEGGFSFWFLEIFRFFLYGSFGFLVGNYTIQTVRRVGHTRGKSHVRGERKLPSSLKVSTTNHTQSAATAATAATATAATATATREAPPPAHAERAERHTEDEDDEEEINSLLDPSLREMDEWLTSFARQLLEEENGSTPGGGSGGNQSENDPLDGERKEGESDDEVVRAIKIADECLATKPRKWQLAVATLQAAIDRDKKAAPAELYWRLARCSYVQAKETPGLDSEQKKEYILKGFNYAEEALKRNDKLADVHKWFAIMAGEVAIFSAPALKIKNGHLVKKHTEEALALSPQDPDLLHMLGRFFYECAEIPWLKKKAAAAAFGPLPEGTFEDAAHRFEQAMRIKPQWIMNEYWLAQTYFKMGKAQQAKKVTTTLLSIPITSRPSHSAEDEQWFAEAEKLHQKL